jgi:thymidylate synthase (FAD)
MVEKYIYGDNIGSVAFVDAMGDDKRAAHAARVSLLNDDFGAIDDEVNDGDKRLIRFLAREMHTSPFEHSSYSVRIVCPLFVRSQIMRHRTFSFNEVSRRYTSENLQFFIPETLRQQADKNLQCSTGEAVEDADEARDLYLTAVASALTTYGDLINAGVCREQARGILPQTLYTEFYMSGNLLNWIKFLRLRLHPHAQPEVQDVALAVKRMLCEDFPFTMEVFFSED